MRRTQREGQLSQSDAQAAAREVREETGMTTDAATLRETVRIEDDAYGRPGVRVRLVCFEGPGSGTPVAGDDEIAEVVWLPPSQWHQFAPAVRKALTARPPIREQNQETARSTETGHFSADAPIAPGRAGLLPRWAF